MKNFLESAWWFTWRAFVSVSPVLAFIAYTFLLGWVLSWHWHDAMPWWYVVLVFWMIGALIAGGIVAFYASGRLLNEHFDL